MTWKMPITTTISASTSTRIDTHGHLDYKIARQFTNCEPPLASWPFYAHRRQRTHARVRAAVSLV